MEIFRISIKHIMKKCQIMLGFTIKKSILDPVVQFSRQIGELVVETKQAVSTGRELTDATAEKLNSSISASRHFKESIEEIQSFVGEQKSSIEQINDLAQQLSQVVEQNVAAAQENAASGTELDQCAQDLRSAVNSFTTKA